ncbi:MAG: ubiquinol-cytochrome c reductase cytochrome b subunit [Pseudonocardiaceae bacterium]
MSGSTTPVPATGLPARAAEAAEELDERFHLAAGMRRQINKVFPTHWSFMLGEIALYTFVVLLLSGTYLALFFDPSMQEVTYPGPYLPLRGIEMSRAFATTMDLSFDVRGGLFIRQIHHWAALVFVAAITVHMFRIFFTGSFRKPREANWSIGVTLLILGILEGFVGYSLPDDLLSGTGLRIGSGIVLSIPVIGTWLHWLLWGGEYPGDVIMPRLYIAHVLIIPGLLAALIAVHLGLIWYQKHTQFPGVGKTESNVVGVRILPTFALKSTGFFLTNVAVLAIMSGLFQINPIWLYGPYNPAQVSAGSQPDWYMGFTEGLLRLFPPWELFLFGRYDIPPVFWAVVLIPGIMVMLLVLYPALERNLIKDNASHNLLQRPRDAPVRTALGVMSITFFLVLLISGGNDVIAYVFDLSINAFIWLARIALLLLPPLAYYLTYRFCLGLQRHDREVLDHGIETGIIRRLPHGEFVEVHQPLGAIDEHQHPIPLQYQGAPVPKRMNQLGAAGKPASGSLYRPDPPDETAAALHTARDGHGG